MTTLSRLILALSLCSLLLAGCQPASATPTLPSATPAPVSPTATPLPATAIPTSEQPTSSSVISAGNASQLKQIAELALPESMLGTLVFSPDSRTLLSGDASGEVNLWERGTWQKTAFLASQSNFKRDTDGKANFSGTLALSLDGKTIITTDFAGGVKGQAWDGKERFAFPFGEQVYQTAISPNGKFLAVGGFGKNLIVFDLETNQQVADLNSDYEFISNLVFSPDGKTLLVSYERPGNVMKTWETSTWQETAIFSHTSERFDYHDILFTSDGKSLVLASTRNVIEFFDLESQQVVKKLPGHISAPYEMALSPDGSLLASAGDDQTLRLWDLKTGKAVLVLRNQHEVGTVAFSPDGTLLAFGVWNEGLQVWALNEELPPAPAASASGLIAFLSDREGQPAIYLMNADGSNQRRLAECQPRGVCLPPVWSPDGQRIAYLVVPNGQSGVSYLHGPLEVWSVGLDGAAPVELGAGVTDTLLAYPWIDPSWSPDGTRLAVAALHPVAGTSDKRSVVTILRSDGSGVEQTFPLDWIASGVEWASNGEQILIQDMSPDESAWATGHNAYVLSLSNGEIRKVSRALLSAAWSPDGTEMVVVPAQPGQVLIVKLDGTSRPIGPLPAGTTPKLAAWSPDGNEIAVFGTTKTEQEASLYLVTISTGQVRRAALAAESLDDLEYSPDGKQLLVSAAHPGLSNHSSRWLRRSQWVYDLSTEKLTALTDGEGFDSHGVWAPVSTTSTAPAVNGEIAFASDLDGDFEIWLMNADGSSPHQLTDNPAADLSPAWSPDGSRLAFISNRDGNDELYTMNADGSDARRLTETPDASESFPAWSPDGQFISFDSDRGGNWDIYIVNSDGSNLRRLTDHPGEDWISSWSPDGSKIAFESKRDGNYEIYVVNLDGSNLQRLTQNTVQDGVPKWSPDGSKIAFFSRRDGNPEIYVVNTDGSNPLRLTNRAGDDSFPAWSSDGAWLVFSFGNNQKSELHIVSADGSQLQVLTSNGAQNWTPAWRPAQ